MKNTRPFGLLLCLFGIALFSSYHLYYYTLNVVNNQKVDKYLEKQQEVEKSTKIVDKKEEYEGVIEIPKIKLKQPFYAIGSVNNNVNKHVQLLKNEDSKDENVIILAAHSGNSYLGYFKNLNQLSFDDEVYLSYHGIKNSYVVSDIYEVEKNGLIQFNHNVNEKILVLTTCSRNKNKQLVVIAKYFNS